MPFLFPPQSHEFTLFTDHKPLTLALFHSSPLWSSRQMRHLAYIFEFTIDIVHTPGSEKFEADALCCPFSLVPASTSAVPVFFAVSLDLSATDLDFSSLPALQYECPSVQPMLSSPSLSVVLVPFQTSSIYCDVSSGSPPPLVPVSLRNRLFLSLRWLWHPGVQASRRLLSSRFVWPCLTKDVGLWTRSCLQCQ